MEALISHLPKVDDKALEFDVTIQDAQFNHKGRYFLRLSIHSLHTEDYSLIQIRKGKFDTFTYRNEIESDVVKQLESSAVCKFKDREFTFRLPTGFCKNDKNHDVYLLVEAFILPESGGRGRKQGEGKFAIYPRPNAPKIKANVDPGENFYKYIDILSLLRTLSTDSVQMHCGRIRSTYALREVVIARRTPPETPKREVRTPVRTPIPVRKSQPTPSPRPPPSPTTSWGADAISFHAPKSPELPPLTDGKKLKEAPLDDQDRKTFQVEPFYRHVSSKGNEQIDVILHGACKLPNTQEGTPPQPYVVVKASDDEDKKPGASTHTTLRPTSSPSWEEMVSCQVEEKKAGDETLVLSVADGPSKQELVDYRIPINSLQPFHQYHLELVKPKRGVADGVRTFVTVTRKLPNLLSDPACPNYLGLEALLQSVQKPLQASFGPLIAVARVVPDFYNYRSDYLISHPRTAGVSMTSIAFPSPHPSSFTVPPRTKHGYPQISLPGRPDVQPTWNHPYLFCDERDKATLFTPSAALVIEYYVANSAMTDQFWRVKSPMGFSALQMDKDMYKELIKDESAKGLRIENLPIQGTDVVTIEGKQPTVGMILRLVTSDTPQSMVQVSNEEDLPTLDLFPEPSAGYFRTTENKTPEILTVTFTDDKSDETSVLEPHTRRSPSPPAYYIQRKHKKPLSPIKDDQMPPYEAMNTVLPDYQYIFVDPDGNHPQQNAQKPYVPVSTRMPGGPSTSRAPDDLDRTSMNVMESQMKELENYRAAVQKMGQDILALRQQIRDLETNNSQLRSDLSNYNDASKLMIESAELDNLTKPEIMSRYAVLKQTLASQSSDLKGYKDRVQRLQNDLIKKNDKEKKYLQMSGSYKQQNDMISKLQERVKRMKNLEEACKKQEKVIERMEKVLEKQHRDRQNRKGQGDKGAQEANEALLEENKRLRQQNDDLRDQLRNAGKSSSSETDKFELYQSLEKANSRIQALEKQLADNSRSWGKERADMAIRLNEAEHGFGRSGGMVLHDYPVLNDKYGRNSPRKLSPLYR